MLTTKSLKIEVNKMDTEISGFLDKKHIKYTVKALEDYKEYLVSSSSIGFKLTVSTSLVGYDFFVLDKKGKGIIGTGEDTDLYPLRDEENIQWAKNIVSDGLSLLTALLAEKVYIGHLRKLFITKKYLVIPNKAGFKIVERSGPLFYGRTIETQELETIPNLQKVSLY